MRAIPRSPSLRKARKQISAELARALICFLVLCNAPPQAGRDVGQRPKFRRERDVCNAPAARTPLTDTTSTQNSTTMSRHFKIITNEVGTGQPHRDRVYWRCNRAYLIKFFGLRKRDVEWFRIEEVQKD